MKMAASHLAVGAQQSIWTASLAHAGNNMFLSLVVSTLLGSGVAFTVAVSVTLAPLAAAAGWILLTGRFRPSPTPHDTRHHPRNHRLIGDCQSAQINTVPVSSQPAMRHFSMVGRRRTFSRHVRRPVRQPAPGVATHAVKVAEIARQRGW